MISTGSFELARTNPAHIGSAPIGSAAASESAGEVKTRGSFENYLLDAIGYVNNTQQHTASVAQQLVTDPESVDIHDVTIAMAEAGMTLSVAQAVIDRVLTAWNEITTTR